jgi:AcrR family transcriptional regulator
MSTTDARRSRLSADREREIYQRVLDTLTERGYEALTMDLIASRARTSKATLYRQWGGKPDLVVAALQHTKPTPDVTDIDTGTLAGDLRVLVAHAGERIAEDAPLMRALMHAMHESPELLRAFREVVLLPEIEGLEGLLRRGVDRGELPPDAPGPEALTYMMLGALIGRPLLEEKEADADFLARYVDAVVLPALGLRAMS